MNLPSAKYILQTCHARQGANDVSFTGQYADLKHQQEFLHAASAHSKADWTGLFISVLHSVCLH